MGYVLMYNYSTHKFNMKLHNSKHILVHIMENKTIQNKCDDSEGNLQEKKNRLIYNTNKINYVTKCYH